jgi:WD40 repeat protein/predicted acylesterase/phospholipase RssA/CRP-like cAMP-binding protein
MSETLPLRKQDYPLLLSFCPDLRRLSDEERARFAELLELVSYPAGHTFYRPRVGANAPPDPEREKLRIVVSGHLQMEKHFGEARGRRSCGPLDMVGEEAVIAWDEVRRGGVSPPASHENLHATELVWVLEIPRSRFAQAFPAGSRTLACMRAAHEVNKVAMQAIDVLESTRQLGNVKSSDLYHVLEGAEVLRTSEVLIRRGQVPTDFFLIFDGRFTFTRPGLAATVLQGPAVVGLDGLIGEVPSDADIRADGAGLVLKISGQTFWQLFTIDADFQRAIVRTNPVSPRFLREIDSSSSTSLLVVLGSLQLREQRKDVVRALGKLTDLLGERIARHLYDRVLVLHLLPPGTATRAPEVRDFTEGFEGEAQDDCPWIEHRAATIDAGFAATVKREHTRPAPPRDTGVARGPADVVLLDVSALGDDVVVQGIVELDVPCKIVHLSPVPGELPPLQFLVRGVRMQHTGVLASRRPQAGVGYALSRSRDGAQRTGAISRAAAVRGALSEVASEVVASASALGSQVLARTKENAMGSSVQAWPIGAVRVRFPEALLAALAEPSPEPACFDALAARLAQGDDGELEPIVGTFDQWARAVTSRRVGVTLSGGGPYGVIHVPLLRKMLARKLPIDLVSGTSVGSSVGAYFAVLGEPGLDLFIEHALRMNLACLASIVSSAAFQAVIGFDLGPVPLIETEIPFFPVVTDADVGIEWDVRHGSYALGVRASGSLPPLGPTIIGNRRFLDGGLVANVPVNVLRDEGAALIIASNAIASVTPGGRMKTARFGALQPLVEVVQELNLLGRLDDLRRMIPLIFRTVGDAQANTADVTYRPSYRDVSFLSSFSESDLRKGEESPELQSRVTDLENRFRSLLRHPPSRVRIDRATNTLRVLSPIGFTADDAVDPCSLPLLGEAAQFLCLRTDGLRITLLGVVVAAKTQVAADRRAAAVVAVLAQGGVDRSRLHPCGVLDPAGGSAVTFPIEKQELSEAEARKKLDELKARAENAERSALAKALTMGAEWNCRRGDLDLGRLLAIEAAALEPSLETDAVLRHALARRGWTVRRMAGVRAVQQLALCPDGRRIAVGHGDGVVRVWDGAIETEAQQSERPLALISHVGNSDPGIAGVAWSRHGSLLASAGFDQRVTVHQVAADGALTPVFQAMTGTWSQWGVAFAPDGRRLLGTGGGSRNKVALWDTSKGEAGAAPVIVDCGSEVRRAAWSADGARIAAATAGGKLLVWKSADEAPVPVEVASSRAPIDTLAWSPSAPERIAFATGSEVHIVEPAPGGAATVLTGHGKAVRHVAWAPSGDRLATASDDGTARIWSADGRFLMNLRGDDGSITGLDWHPSGRMLATFSEAGTCVIWEPERGEPIARLLGHAGAINVGGFTEGGRRFVTGSLDATLRVWDPLRAAQIGWRGHEGRWSSNDPGLVATAGDDGSVELVDPRTGKAIAALLATDPVGPAKVALDPQGARIAAAREGGSTIVVWSKGRYEAPLFTLEDSSSERALALSFSPDGRYLAVKRLQSVGIWDLSVSPPTRRALDVSQRGAPRDVLHLAWDPTRPGRLAVARWCGTGAVALYDLARGDAPIGELQGSTDGVWQVAFGPDGALLVAGCNDAKAYVHDAVSGELLGVIPHTNAVKCLAFGAPGLLGTGDGGRSAAVFQLQASPFAARSISARNEHLDAIEVVAFSRDGSLFASGSAGGRVSLFRRASGATTFVPASLLHGHGGKVRSLSFSPSGAELLTTADDGTALVHLVDAAALLDAVGRIPGPGAMSLDDWLRFFGTSAPHRPTWPRPAGPRRSPRQPS